MADRYQDQPFAADDHYDHGGNPHAPGRVESDPLAELARLIGQADPFGGAPKAPPHPQPRPQPLQSRANVRPQQQYETQAEEDEGVPAGPPPWMQRARQEPPQPVAAPQEHYQEHYEEQEPEYQPSPVHPLHRYAAQHVAPEPEYREDLPFPDAGQEPDPSRYDDALYGRIESGEQDFQRDPAYPEDPYAYQSGYEEEEPAPRKRSGLMAVVAVLALAVVGTGAAFAYRTYVGSPRSGEPPIIKADNSPTKIVPAPADGVAKTPDRMVPGDGAEKLVSREETPVDVTAKTGGPRVVFPPLNPNSNPPSVASVSPTTPPPPMAANGTMPNSEPRKIRTLSVKGDAADAGIPASAPPPPAKQPATAAAKPGVPRNANASANTPLALTPGAPPDSAPAPARVASTNPAPAASGGGGYVVQVSSQKNEADAQASYRALQSKFPSVLGSRAPLIKRADLGDKGVYYRAMVGPFGSPDEASQFCGSLKSAGGQCVVQRN